MLGIKVRKGTRSKKVRREGGKKASKCMRTRKIETFGAKQMIISGRIVGLGVKMELYERVVVRRVTYGMRPCGLMTDD